MEKLLANNHLISLISTPIIWAVHFVVCYGWVSVVCAAGIDALHIAGIGIAALGVGVATVMALALIAYAGALNIRKWRVTRHAHHNDNGIPVFFAINSILLCVLSALAVIWVAFPAAMLPACAV